MIEVFFINDNKDGWYKAGMINPENGKVVEDNTDGKYLDDYFPDNVKRSAKALLNGYNNHYVTTSYVPEDERDDDEGDNQETEKSSTDVNVIELTKTDE